MNDSITIYTVKVFLSPRDVAAAEHHAATMNAMLRRDPQHHAADDWTIDTALWSFFDDGLRAYRARMEGGQQ